MKKVAILSMLLTFIFLFSNRLIINGVELTGHSEFYEIEFEDSNNLLINKLKENELKENYDNNCKSRFIGWRTNYYLINAKMNYVGEIIFSRSNKTSNPITFKYETKQTTTKSRSVKVATSISQKASGGDKILNASLQQDIDTEIEGIKTLSQTETISFDVIIPINKKVTLRTAGNGVVSNGYSCFYFFWIKFKKGSWEIVDVIDVFYELYEESI